jgi:peptidoglycan pentaglycine glycine transferase (the first glycine)
MALLSPIEWDRFLEKFPGAHLLQSSAWGKLKASFGWEPVAIAVEKCGAQILFRKLPLGFSVGYIPKGPVGTDWRFLWPELDILCRQKRAVFLKVEPDLWENQDPELDKQFTASWQKSASIQPRRTVILDLTGGEDVWLQRMKQKTRYNIRLAQKKNVVIRQTDDAQEFHKLMQITGKRDGFGIHSLEYYQLANHLFSSKNKCAILTAFYENIPLAALMVFASGSRAWYFYGASTDEERQRMPTYLLQFEAMRWAFRQGCTTYDLWGVPDFEEETLEAQFAQKADNLWGVYRFKRGFGGQLMRSSGAYDRIYQPLLYRLYQQRYAHRNGGQL